MSEISFIDAFLAPFRGAGEVVRGSDAVVGPAREGAAIDVRRDGVLVGPGSDCAVVQPARGMRLVATTDAVIEHVHFDLRWFTPEDVGHKALAVNLSDLAAAGARPRWFLCALGVPRKLEKPEHFATRLGKGMAELAAHHGCVIIGGNVSAASELSLTITALGEARKPLTRAGGRPGDALVLAGSLGDAALGLRELRKGGRGSRAQLRPTPLVEAGLAAARLASAAIDISDGLVRDLGQLCEQSGCGATVECSKLPLGRAVRRAKDGLELGLSGGEDYALLFAVPRRKLAELLRATDGVEIGELVEGSGLSLTDRGLRRELPPRAGFDHLA